MLQHNRQLRKQLKPLVGLKQMLLYIWLVQAELQQLKQDFPCLATASVAEMLS